MTSKPAKDLINRFLYLKWDDIFYKERPFQVLIDIPPEAQDQRKQNLDFEVGENELVRDVRGLKASMGTLDETGFSYIINSTKLSPRDFEDRENIELRYLAECEELLKKELDHVDEVAIYDWRVRHTDLPTRHGSVIDLNDPMSPIGAATHVHVDQSPGSVVERIKRMFPDRQELLLQFRVRLINLWHPINGPIQNWPLAVCDGRTLQKSNLVETERIRRTFTGNTMFLMKGSGVKWYYLSEQQDNEVLIFKSFDSREDVTRYAAHGSFDIAEPSKYLPPRQSIEVRALIFSYPVQASRDGGPTT